MCRAWGNSLPSRSREDDEQTIDEITYGYAVFALICPAHEHLIPPRVTGPTGIVGAELLG